MDAGPGLNFFSVNKERLLIATIGPIAIPEVVHTEIRRKADQDRRFAAAGRVLQKLPEKYLEILEDATTPELAAVVQRISRLPLEVRRRTGKDLGEMMVVAHAVVEAETGQDVVVLIDDGGGRKMAQLEAARLNRLKRGGRQVGSIALMDTLAVLRKAAGTSHIPDRNSMRELYSRLRQLDDGLVPLPESGLQDLPCWKAVIEENGDR